MVRKITFIRKIIRLLSRLPIDLGQGTGNFKHTTKAKLIAFESIPKLVLGARALDLGCGDGYWADKLKNLGYQVTPVDIPRTYPNLDFDKPYKGTVFADMNQPFPLEDNSFDLIWCTEVIEHLINHKQTVKEIMRVLKPGGCCIITTPNSFFWLHYFFKLFGLSNKQWQHEDHVNFFHIKQIKELFPGAKIYGYFPYMIVKFKIKSCISFLSPSFVIVGQKI